MIQAFFSFDPEGKKAKESEKGRLVHFDAMGNSQTVKGSAFFLANGLRGQQKNLIAAEGRRRFTSVICDSNREFM